MHLRVQPKPEVSCFPADQGIISRKEFFVKRQLEEIKQYFFPALFIRPWKAKAELLFPSVSDTSAIQYECDYNRDVQNCFVEDYAEEIFLRTPPTCFVVFGKPGACVAELSKQIAEEYGSILLNVDDIVERVLQTETQTAKLLDRILRLGLNLTLNFILALLSYMAHTPEARHRGYVLCGLPSLALLQDMPVEQQFNYLFTWDNKPTIFVNVLFQDEDLIKERSHMRYELRNLGEENSLYGYLEDSDFTEDDEEEELQVIVPPNKEEIVLEPDIDILPSRPTVQLPKDEESRVWTELEMFDAMIKPAIDIIRSRVDPQCYIVVDSRVDNRYETVKAQLNLLHVWRAPEATPFLPPHLEKSDTERESEENETEGEVSIKETYDEDILRVAEEPPNVAFLTLFAKKTISPKFRWELSHYNYICPVSLREGEVVEGKSRFAVVFMKYIYFLRDQESMAKFLKNPRAYVLPVRPKPLCRFFILGYPFTGKTTLARTMSNEFYIPLIDVEEVLKNDAERKKSSYQEFCRQKAECRELIRLTALAWKDWRMEEEKRINLIEEWIVYLQSLLQKRIEQFYSGEGITGKMSEKSVPQGNPSGDPLMSSAKTSGLSILERRPKYKKKDIFTPSKELIEAVKEGRSDFNKGEANSYFSYVWKSFSGRSRRCYEESASEEDYCEGLFLKEDDESDDESRSVNWCDLLPPQSLSGFLITNLPYTTKVKRRSFKIFLEAASKAYHEPSVLKSEFAKWHLPCFMDIPLCGILLENPTFLLRYVPIWLRERPLIPDPVDPKHPSVVAEGEKAYLKASLVVVRQNEEEQGILIRNAIEKAEREGMRVTGEVITPGGWVVDNMTLDLGVWKKLLCDKVFADHVYILVDSEPGYRRIITTWWEAYGKEACSRSSLKPSESEEMGEQGDQTDTSVYSGPGESSQQSVSKSSVISLLEEWVNASSKGDKQLDDIFDRLRPDISNIKYFVPPFSVDPFCHSLFQNTTENWNELKDDGQQEEDTFIIQTLTGLVSRSLFWNRELTASFTKIPLGTQLETCTEAVIDFFKKKQSKVEAVEEIKMGLTGCLEFFKYLHSLPGKLDQLKELFQEAGRGETIEEVEINGRTPDVVFEALREKLIAPFNKRPRELEDFEVEEIRASTGEKEPYTTEEEEDEEESEVGEKDETEVGVGKEDIRIFGESGPLCIVSLERNKFLLGRPEYCLRYYGKLYYFWNQACKDKFLEDPEKYAPYYSAIRCYPPLRIYVVGPIGSGRATMANAIGHQCWMVPVDFSSFVRRKLLPFCPTAKKFEVIDEHSLLLAENHNEPAFQLKEQFMRVPYGKRKFWLEHSFHTSYEDNKEMYDLLQKISINPVSFGDFPELKYLCVESVYDTYGDDYVDLQPKIMDYSDTPFISMKELSKVLEDYSVNFTELKDYVKSVNALWEDEPFVYQGFVLKGFPRRSQDVNFIIEQTWIPDLIIEIVLPEQAIIERNVGRLMDRWELKLKKELADQEALELALTSIQSMCRDIRQRELYLEQRKQTSLADNLTWRKGSGDSDSSEKDHRSSSRVIARKRRMTLQQEVHWSTDELMVSGKIPEAARKEIESTLDSEFPPLVFKPVFETFESAKERVVNNLIKNSRRETAELDEIKPILTDLNIPWYEIDGLKTPKMQQHELFMKLDKIRGQPPQKGEFAFVVTMDMAEKLLHQGYYLLSKFGKLCPVQASRKKNPIHMFRPLSAKGKVIPVAYRNYIYFIAGENEKTKFLENPVKYIFTNDQQPTLPLRVAVIGPPKSGKSTLCKRLGVMFGLKVVTMGSALRFALQKTPESTLAKSINGYLRRGCFLPLSLKLEALMLYLIDPSCGTQGFVFDGIPFDAALTQSLAERGKLPFVIISLVADSHFGKVNREQLNLEQFRLPYKNRINLDTRYKDWMETYKRFANWNQSTYNNLYEVNAKLNSVEVFYKAYDIIKESHFGILNYFKHCLRNKALPLSHLCIGQQEFQSKRGFFGNNCPVCWAEANRLRNPDSSRPKSGLVEYQSQIYWVCSEHMSKFLKNPKKYMPTALGKWPEALPKRLTVSVEMRESLQIKVHGYGRCPVTRTDFPSCLEWEGSWDHAVTYGDKIYLCKNEKMVQRFLAQPWRYNQASTIFEAKRTGKSNAVINLGPPKLTSLPPIGFLEQTVADLLHESLQNVGSLRPIYPKMHPKVTGCIFLALFLKVNNKNKKPCSLDHEFLDFFIRNCQSTKYKVTVVRPPYSGLGQGDFEPDVSEDSDSSSVEVSRRSNDLFERNWLDFETQAAKRMWSAKNLSQKYVEMKLTDKNELLEIPEVPASVAILRLENFSLRPSPIPPIEDCLNFIYSVPTRLRLPEKFNYNCLHQPLLAFTSPFTPQILFNPQKQFSQSLFERKDPGFPSLINLHHDKRVMSDCSVTEGKTKSRFSQNFDLLTKGFFPRFAELDKLTPTKMPAPPQVVEKEPLIMNPNYDHSYMMLMSEFFHTTHYLRYYHYADGHRHMGFLDRFDRTLDLDKPDDHFLMPQKTISKRSRTSVDSYQDIFDSVTPFLIPDIYSKPFEGGFGITRKSKAVSLSRFIETALMEQYDRTYLGVTSSTSYESFEINVVPTNSDVSCSEVVVRESLAYPPLPWDIMTRPYYAFCSVPSIFDKPHLDNIAHERHVSLLDGITEFNEGYRFVAYPGNVQTRLNTDGSAQTKRRKSQPVASDVHFYYDFFNIPWTSFMSYQYKWLFGRDPTEILNEKGEVVDEHWPAGQRPLF